VRAFLRQGSFSPKKEPEIGVRTYHTQVLPNKVFEKGVVPEYCKRGVKEGRSPSLIISSPSPLGKAIKGIWLTPPNRAVVRYEQLFP
jgi:hypothetical protein